MIDFSDLALNALWIMKSLHDHGMGESLFSYYADEEVCDDRFFEMGLEAISCIFDDTRITWNDEEEFCTYLFFDPIIDDFTMLCQQYEDRTGIAEKDNTFRQDMDRILRSGFCYNSYCHDYTWELSRTRHGRKRILLFGDYQFMISGEVINGLLEIYDGFHYQVKQLRRELAPTKSNVIPFPTVRTELEVAA